MVLIIKIYLTITILLLGLVGVFCALYILTDKKLKEAQADNNTNIIAVGASDINPYSNLTSIPNFKNSHNGRILCIGDTNFLGAGSLQIGQRNVSATPYFLTVLLNQVFNAPYSSQNFFGSDSSSFDSRVVSDRFGFDSYPSSNIGLGGRCYSATNSAASLTFTPDVDVRGATVEVYSLQSSGNFTLTMGNMSPISVNPSALSPVSGNIVKYSATYNGLIQTPAMKITGSGATSSKPVQIFGMACRVNGSRDVINGSYSPLTTTAITTSTHPTAILTSGALALNPSLVIIKLGPSDYVSNTGTTQDQFVNNMNTIVGFFRSRNIEVLVVLPEWTNGMDSGAQQSWSTALKSSLDNNAVAYYDFQADMISLQKQIDANVSDNSGGLNILGSMRMAQGIIAATA